MAVIHEPIPDKSTPWENYGGQEVENYIKGQLDLKAGCFYYDQDNNRYMVFADEANRDLYLDDPEEYASLLIASFDAPFNYSASIELVDTPTVQYLALGSTGNYIKANFEIVDKTGNPVADNYNVTITIRNGSATQKLVRSVTYGTQFLLNVDEYLSEGTNIVSVGIVGKDTLAATSVGITYNVINLQLSDNHDISQVYAPSGQLRITYTVSGSGIKTVEWYLDGEQLESSQEDIIQTPTATRLKTIELSDYTLSNGRHNIQYRAYVQAADGVTFYSVTLFRDFIVNDGYLFTDTIATAFDIPADYDIIDAFDEPIPLYGAVQYVAKNIKYAVYSPFNTTIITVALAQRSTTYEVENGVMYSYDIKSFSSGNTAFSLTLGDTTLSFNAVIGASPYTDLEEITNGLVLAFSGNEKSNSSDSRDVWSYGSYRGSLSGFRWTSRSGWTDNGLLMDAGTSFSVSNYKPLNTEARTNGATFEFEFETRRVLDDDAVICDLRTNGAGILITASEASLTTRGGTVVSAKYKSGESARIGFVINGDQAGRKTHLMQIYIDGINCGTVNYNASDSFLSSAALGFAATANAEILLKYIRTYERPLSDEEMLNNYILYRQTTDELVTVYDRNDILDSNGQPSSDKLAAETPILIITGDIDRLMDFTSKDTYLYVPKVEVVNNADPTKNLTIVDASMRCQGTSSMNYPIKNMRLYLQKDSADDTVPPYTTKVYDYLGNELTGKNRLYAFPVPGNEKPQPVKTWCFKADYAESSSTHNTGVARLWNDVMKNARIDASSIDSRHYVKSYFPDSNFPCRTLAQHYADKNSYEYDVRTTVDGFPCSIFYHKTESAPLICLGKYNWNNDKSTESVFGFKDVPEFDDEFGDTMQCWETITGDLEINQFQSVEHWNDTYVDSDGNLQPMWRQNFEARYPDDAGEESEKTRADDTLYDFCAWVASTNGASKVQNGRMVVDNQTKMNKFKAEKWDHLDVYKTSAYYLYLMRFGAVDQPVKNSMLTAEDGIHFFYINYDNDTVNGLINSGLLKLGYDVNRQSPDPDDPNAYAYAGHASVLWNNLEADDEFMAIVKTVDQALYVAGLKYSSVISMFNNEQSAKWSERLHNYDYTFKYLDPYYDRGINNLGMLQGPRRTHRQWWLSHRFALYDGINATGQFRGSYIQLRPNGSGAALTGDVAVVTPAVDGQVFGWSIGNAQEAPHAVNGTKDTPITFDFHDAAITWYIGGFIFFFNIVYVKSLDLSAISRVVNRLDFTQMESDMFEPELEEVILGKPSSTSNTHLASSEIMNIQQVKYLRKFQMCNYKAVTTLDFSENGYLEELDLRGCGSDGTTTGTTGVTLPVAAPINTIYYPNSIQSVVMQDLLDLDTFVIDNDGPAVTTFNVRNCGVFCDSPAWLLDWMDGKSDSFLAGVNMTVMGVNWNNVSVNDLIAFGSVGTLRFTGKIGCTGLNTVEQAEALMAIYGPHCFESTNELWISSSSALTFFSGPDEVVEGNTAQYAFVVISGEAGSVSYSVAGSPTGVSIQSETGLLTTTLTGRADFSITLGAVFTEEESGVQTFGTKIVTIKKETYPSASDVVINGPAVLTDVESQYSASILDTDYTGVVNHRWRLVADEPDTDTDITDYFEIWSAPSDELVCTIRRVDNTYLVASGSLVFELVNRLGTVVTSKSYAISAMSANIAVSRAANEPIMDAFWNAYGEGGSLVSTRGQKLSNRNYISKAEAITFIGEDLNPTGGQTSSIFYPQRNNITHFEEFQYFMGVTEIPACCFFECTKLEEIVLPPQVTTLKEQVFRRCTVLDNLVIPDSVTTLGSYDFGQCYALRSLTANNVTSIPSSLFWESEGYVLEEVIMPSCTSVGSRALGSRNLRKVYLPKCTSFGEQYYMGSNAEEIELTLGYVTNSRLSNAQSGKLKYIVSRYASSESMSVATAYHAKTYSVEAGNTTFYSTGECVIRNSDKTLLLAPRGSLLNVPEGVIILHPSILKSDGNVPSYTSIHISSTVTRSGVGSRRYQNTWYSFPWNNENTVITVSSQNSELSTDEYGNITNKSGDTIKVGVRTSFGARVTTLADNSYDANAWLNNEAIFGERIVSIGDTDILSNAARVTYLGNVTSTGRLAVNGTATKQMYVGENVTNLVGGSPFGWLIGVTDLYFYPHVAPAVNDTTFSYGAWVGSQNKSLGTNKLHVPIGATGYNTGSWLKLCDPAYAGFTLVYDL